MRAPHGPARASSLAPQVARGWSVYVTLMGAYWAAGGAGYPFGHQDPHAPDYMSILVSMDASVGGPAIAATGVVGLVLASLLERGQTRTTGRRTAMILAGGFACVLVTVIVDSRALMLLPPLGLIPVKWAEADWPSLFQMTVPVAAASFVLATVTMARSTADRSPRWPGPYGRSITSLGPSRPDRSARRDAVSAPLRDHPPVLVS